MSHTHNGRGIMLWLLARRLLLLPQEHGHARPHPTNRSGTRVSRAGPGNEETSMPHRTLAFRALHVVVYAAVAAACSSGAQDDGNGDLLLPVVETPRGPGSAHSPGTPTRTPAPSAPNDKPAEPPRGGADGGAKSDAAVGAATFHGEIVLNQRTGTNGPTTVLSENLGSDLGLDGLTGDASGAAYGPCVAEAAGTGARARAGTVTFHGGQLPSAGVSLTDSTVFLPSTPAFNANDSITIHSAGTADIGPFTATALAPSEITVTSPSGFDAPGNGTLDRASDLVVSWTGAGAGSVVRVLIGGDKLLRCDFQGPAGAGTIPKAALATLAPADATHLGQTDVIVLGTNAIVAPHFAGTFLIAGNIHVRYWTTIN